MSPDVIFCYIFSLLLFVDLNKCQSCIPDIKWVKEQGYAEKNLQTSNYFLSSNTLAKCMRHCEVHSSDEIVHYNYSTKQCLCLTIFQQHYLRTYRTDEETLTFLDFTFKSNVNSE